MSADGRVVYAKHGAVALITLDRPSAKNALTAQMLASLATHVREADRDESIRAIVLTGEGKEAFSAGGDLNDLLPRAISGELELIIPEPTERFFSECRTPIVAAVNGLCLAGGLEIVLGTDIRIASDQAVFGVPEVRWGLVPSGGSHVRLPQQIPWALAMEMLLTGAHISAGRALAAGLVNDVVPANQVLERAMEFADRIASNGPVAVQTAKRIAVESLGNPARYALEFSLADRVMRSDDAKEGPRAFTEKRPPNFTGK